VIEELRTTVGGLRPAMLNYGLYPALSQLVEDLRDRVGVNQRIVFEVHSRMERYHPIAEHQIYEIIHQACENSLRHANAKNLIIEGNLGVNDMQITVRDDGDGFEMHAQPDLLELLQQSQFGLAGMYERAELISARLSLFTAPGKGTSVSVSWLPADLNEEDIQFLMS
jgi:signal transduction histidine kinase